MDAQNICVTAANDDDQNYVSPEPVPVPDPSQTIEVSNLYYSGRLQCHIYNLRGLQVKLEGVVIDGMLSMLQCFGLYGA